MSDIPPKEFVYVMDSDVIIEMRRRSYLPEIFIALWERVEALIVDGRLITCDEVKRELEVHDDEILRWVSSHPNMVRPFDEDQAAKLSEIMAKFPQIAQTNKSKAHADPILVALACVEQQRQDASLMPRKVLVLTKEGAKGPPQGNYLKVPHICKEFCIPSININEFFQKEGWRFD